MALTFPTPLQLSEAVANQLSGGRIEPLGLPIVLRGTKPSASPDVYSRINNMVRTLALYADSNLRAVKDGALTVAVCPGRYRDAAGTEKYYQGSTGNSLTNNATNSIYIVTATNTLTISTSGFPGSADTYVPIAQYVTLSGAIVPVDSGVDANEVDFEADRRHWTMCQVHATSTSPTGTTGTSFTLDSDNAGAGADTQYRANRGSTDSEDAALEWDETNDRWNVLEQHTTGTACPINASEIQVAGTAVIESDGDLAAASIAADQLYVFGANGSSPYGVRLTASGSSGAPASGTHAVGELALDTNAVLYICTSDGTPGTWKKLGDSSFSYLDEMLQVTMDNPTGGSPQDVTIQIKDREGNNLSEVVYLEVGVWDDADGGTEATNATIAVGGSGTLVRSVSAGKRLVCKTDSSGELIITVTDGTTESVYLTAAASHRSHMLDCTDYATVTIT